MELRPARRTGWLDQLLREPQLFACADCHRATTVASWVTVFSCDTPAVIRLS